MAAAQPASSDHAPTQLCPTAPTCLCPSALAPALFCFNADYDSYSCYSSVSPAKRQSLPLPLSHPLLQLGFSCQCAGKAGFVLVLCRQGAGGSGSPGRRHLMGLLGWLVYPKGTSFAGEGGCPHQNSPMSGAWCFELPCSEPHLFSVCSSPPLLLPHSSPPCSFWAALNPVLSGLSDISWGERVPSQRLHS